MLHTMHTVNGKMELIYMNDFPNYVVREKVQTNTISYATQNHNPGSFDDFVDVMSKTTFVRHDIVLDNHVLVTSRDMMATRKPDYQNRAILEAQNKLILDDFKVMIAQKEPTYFLKDLNLESIEKLNFELARNGMSGQVLGVQVQLSEWQKFFVICNIEDMKFYFNERLLEHMDGMKVYGKLINLKPNMLVMARYENLIYLNEITAVQRYMSPVEGELRPNYKMNTIIQKPFGWD